jgi:iron(III) transport system substrate-binding protein
MLSEEAQRYFTQEAFEYPVAKGVAPSHNLPPLNTLTTPDIDLSDLSDLERTLQLLRDAGAI